MQKQEKHNAGVCEEPPSYTEQKWTAAMAISDLCFEQLMQKIPEANVRETITLLGMMLDKFLLPDKDKKAPLAEERKLEDII